ncbi:MAG TPA: 6-pyruvoyl-tetrahydropterin synthase-related protein, partial [Chloroflexota bacterium]|nr:6-pyruvoyl-tetrahydropterin synthase-related protein [Chloroflexota bacterium]
MFALAPLVRGPMFASADGLLHLYRLVEFDQAIRSGIWYPRWAPDLLAGYGYPIFIFYAPLLYYLAEALHLAGLGFVDAIKAAVATGMLASTAGMYVFARDLWGRWGGFLAAAAYLYAPYRLVNTYLDGELAQTLAWAWLPWLAWASWRYLRTTRIRYAALATLCYGGLIATHSVTSWLATFFLGLALAAMLAGRAVSFLRTIKLGGCLAAGAALAAPYWLPALAEQGNVQLDRVRIATYDFHTNLLPLARTIALQWAHPYDQYLGANGPAQLGLIQALVAIAAIVALLAAGRRRWPVAALFGGLAVTAFVLMLQPAAVFWDHMPFGRFLQFPDRLLAILAFCLAILAGGLPGALRRLPGPAVAGCALLASGALIFGATARLDVNYIALPASLGPAQVTEYEQISGAFGTTAKGEFTPRWLGDPPLTSPLIGSELTGTLPPAITSGNAQVRVTSRQAEAMNATVTAAEAGPAALPVAYYPGWSAKVNGQAAAVKPSSKGLAEVPVPAGQSDVTLRFGTSPDRRLGDGIGLLAALSLAGLALGRWLWARPLKVPPLPGAEPLVAVAAGAAVLAVGLWLAPDKLKLESWPVQRTEFVGYGGWIQFMGADVRLDGDHAHVTTAYRTGAAQSARPFTATVQMLSRETVWASGSQSIPKEGWTTGVPRKVDVDVPIPPGTPPGVYLLVLEI